MSLAECESSGCFVYVDPRSCEIMWLCKDCNYRRGPFASRLAAETNHRDHPHPSHRGDVAAVPETDM